MECKCGCHTGDGMTGHDGLCCSLPNGLKKNNPHKNLKEAKYYEKILDKWEADVVKSLPSENKPRSMSNFMMIDVNWIDSSIQNYIDLKQKINKNGNDPIITQDYNAKIRILKEVKKQLIITSNV
tara:strand:- start:1269 stop:1643 length:375 start_codon:yes stop_codon:yes gene_type:complete